MRRYKPFERLVGCEAPIQKFVTFLEHARDGLLAERQIVSFVGPNATGKSTMATICQELFETQPVWVLGFKADNGDIESSPVFEGPLGLFNKKEHGEMCEREFHIPSTRLIAPMSGWATARFEKSGRNLSRFVAVRIMPSKAKGILLATVDPDTTSVHSFIGSADRRGNLEEYEYSGVFNRTTTGILEFAEMWNAEWTPLQKFLSVTQERRYVGDGAIGILPYQGLIIAHGNEKPWLDFKAGNFARSGKHFTGGLIDRICSIEFPYCIRITELAQLYEGNLRDSGFKDLHLAPGSLEVAAAFAAATRQKNPADCSIRLDIHDGRYVGKDVKTAEDLRVESHWRDGMGGITERVMQSALPQLATADPEEQGLDPVLVLEELGKFVVRERLPNYGEPDDGKEGGKRSPTSILEDEGKRRCKQLVEQAIQEAYFEDWPGYVAAKFEEYVDIATAWCEDTDYKPAQGEIIRFPALSEVLRGFENGIQITGGVKEYRERIVFSTIKHRSKAENAGKLVWGSLPEHLRVTFEQNVRPKKTDMLELIDPNLARKDPKKLKEHTEFLARMCAKGYTMRQVRRVLEWYVAHGK